MPFNFLIDQQIMNIFGWEVRSQGFDLLEELGFEWQLAASNLITDDSLL